MTDGPAAAARPSRRTVLTTGGSALGLVAVGLGASAAVTACSSGSGAAGGGGATGPVTVKAADVPVGGGFVDDRDNVLVVQPVAGSFKAFSAICPHQGCVVGSPVDGIITCPCHGSTFKADDGSLISGPATQGLTTKTATVQGSEVVVT